MAPSGFRLRLAALALRQGEVVAYPTEGVWGLGCDPDNEAAVQHLLRLKNRPLHKGLILVAASREQLQPYLHHLGPAQLQTLTSRWPGPHTWLVPANERVPPWISGGHDRVALRVSAHPLVVALCQAFGGPIVSTSANPSGRRAATSALAVQLQFPDLLRVPGSLTAPGKPSTICDLETGQTIRP